MHFLLQSSYICRSLFPQRLRVQLDISNCIALKTTRSLSRRLPLIPSTPARGWIPKRASDTLATSALAAWVFRAISSSSWVALVRRLLMVMASSDRGQTSCCIWDRVLHITQMAISHPRQYMTHSMPSCVGTVHMIGRSLEVTGVGVWLFIAALEWRISQQSWHRALFDPVQSLQ